MPPKSKPSFTVAGALASSRSIAQLADMDGWRSTRPGWLSPPVDGPGGCGAVKRDRSGVEFTRRISAWVPAWVPAWGAAWGPAWPGKSRPSSNASTRRCRRRSGPLDAPVRSADFGAAVAVAPVAPGPSRFVGVPKNDAAAALADDAAKLTDELSISV